jgi:release factor glutamine methyltransferase
MKEGNVLRYRGLHLEVPPEVYDPAEDTFLLLEALEGTLGERVLDLGTGCGIIALACALRGLRVVATDNNPHAVAACQRNVAANRALLRGALEVRAGDLFGAVGADEAFDTVVFNPPYVPTPPGERLGHWLDCATSGGPDGLQVTRRFLAEVGRHLTSTGQALTIVSSRSPQQAVQRLLRQHRLAGTIVQTARFEDEDLKVLLLTPTA